MSVVHKLLNFAWLEDENAVEVVHEDEAGVVHTTVFRGVTLVNVDMPGMTPMPESGIISVTVKIGLLLLMLLAGCASNRDERELFLMQQLAQSQQDTRALELRVGKLHEAQFVLSQRVYELELELQQR